MMLTSLPNKFTVCCLLTFLPFACASADGEGMRSYHLGLMYPNGADIAGYTVEHKTLGHLYSFYTFGFPAVASAGLSYYANYAGNGFMASCGIGLGYLSMAHGSIAYQWRIEDENYVKLGVGYSSTLVFNGAFPVLSYEHRFR